MNAETQYLLTLPELSDPVNENDPRTWMELLSTAHITARNSTAVHYTIANVHYIVYKRRIITAYAYHGKHIFATLHQPEQRERMFQRWIDYDQSLKDLCAAIQKLTNTLDELWQKRHS